MKKLLRRILRPLLKWLLIFLLAPYAVAFIYLFIYPPSTLMLLGWLTFSKVEREWVPIERISPVLIAAVVASEDDAFCSHWGVDFRQLTKSIRHAKTNDKPVRATSTITQQLAKNLFLWHGRSWLRKFLEIPLTFWLELTWSKKDILETYLNIAEWGEGVYGAEAAAQFHFGTSANALSYMQAALLATSLPNPTQRRAARPGPAQANLAAQLVARLQHNGPDMVCVNK